MSQSSQSDLSQYTMTRLKDIAVKLGIQNARSFKAADKNRLISIIRDPQLKYLGVKRLKTIAKDLGITGLTTYNNRNRNALINRIQEEQQTEQKAYSPPRQQQSPRQQTVNLDIEGITKLKAIARALGIKGFSKFKTSNKDQLIALIRQAQQGGPPAAQPPSGTRDSVPAPGLDDLGITKLKAIAKPLGIKGLHKFKTANKDRLVALIRQAQDGGLPESRRRQPIVRPPVVVQPAVQRLSPMSLQELGITKLKAIAKGLGITGLSKFRARDKNKVIGLIMAKTAPAPRSPSPIRARSPSLPSQLSAVPEVSLSSSPVRLSLPPSPERKSRSPSPIITPDYGAYASGELQLGYVPPSPPTPVSGASVTYHPASPTREISITRRDLYDPTVQIPSPDYGAVSPRPREWDTVSMANALGWKIPQRISPVSQSSRVSRVSPEQSVSPPPRRREGRVRVFPSDPSPIPVRSPPRELQRLSPKRAHHIFTAPRILTLQEVQNVLTNLNIMEPEQSKEYVRADVERCLGLM